MGVQLYDATLRDGMQGEGLTLTAAEKLRVAHKLDELGIHLIEAGFPPRIRRSSSSSSCWRARRSPTPRSPPSG